MTRAGSPSLSGSITPRCSTRWQPIRTSNNSLAFTATANGSTVNLGPFYNAHGHNYTVYWNTNGQGGATARLVN